MKKGLGLFVIVLGILWFGGAVYASDRTIQDNAFTYYNGASSVNDGTASDGMAGKMSNNSAGWNISYVASDFSTLEPGELYDIYFRVKVDHAAATPTGNAFKMGVWDNTYGGFVLSEKAIASSATQDLVWKEFKIGTFRPNATVNQLSFYVAGTNNASQVSDIYVDSLIFKRYAPQTIESSAFNLYNDAVRVPDGYTEDNEAAVLYNGPLPQWSVQAPIDGSKIDPSKTYHVFALLSEQRSDWLTSSGDVLGVLVYDATNATYPLPPKVYNTSSGPFSGKYQLHKYIQLNDSPLTLNPDHTNFVAFKKVNNADDFPSVRIDKVFVQEVVADDQLPQAINAVPYKISPANGDGLFDGSEIAYTLPASHTVFVEIANASGTIIRTLTNGVAQSGSQSVWWDGKNNGGSFVSNGLYTVKVRTSSTLLFQKNIEVVSGLALSAPASDPSQFFPLGNTLEGMEIPYISGDASDYLDRVYEDMVDVHANTVYILNMVKSVPLLLDKANDYGLKVIGSPNVYDLLDNKAMDNDEQALYDKIGERIATLMAKPAFLGYELYDEPANNLKLAQKLNRFKRVIGTIDPDHPVIINYVGPDSAETNFNVQKTQVVMADPYGATLGYPVGDFTHMSHQPHVDYKPYLDFLHMLSKKDPASQAPVWTILQNFNAAPYFRDPTAEELRAMTYLAIGHGSKGIFYFHYNSENVWTGMVDYAFNPTAKYATVKALLGEIETLKPTIQAMEKISSVATASGGGNTTSAAHPQADVTTHVDYATGNKYLVVVNHDCLNPANITITIDRAKLGMNITGITNMLDSSSISYTTTANSYIISNLSFSAGDGKILKLVRDTTEQMYTGQDAAMTLYNGALSQAADYSASDDKTAVKVVQATNGWDMQWYWDKAQLTPGAAYDLYAVVKIKYALDLNVDVSGFPFFVQPTGAAFKYGVYDATTGTYPVAETQVNAADMDNMLWKTIKLGSFVPSQSNTQLAYIYPSNNPGNVYAVYVDKFYFVKK